MQSWRQKYSKRKKSWTGDGFIIVAADRNVNIIQITLNYTNHGIIGFIPIAGTQIQIAFAHQSYADSWLSIKILGIYSCGIHLHTINDSILQTQIKNADLM